MKIFVSHAIKDSNLINDLKSALEPRGLQLLIAEHHSDINYSTVTDKIEKMINTSNIALILLTNNGFNSNFVQQEIGYIKSAKIPYLQIIEKGLEKKITGFNYGKGYIEYSPESPQTTIDKIKQSLLDHWIKQIQFEIAQINQKKAIDLKLKQQKEQEQALKIGLGLLAGILVLGMIDN